MAFWSYEIFGKAGELLASDFGYETEAEAELFAGMYVKEKKLRGFQIRTRQRFEELEGESDG